ncbi:MAG: S9 family peptidase [Gammaproteobacteria bacterium]|nr:S9 family peptidase [Gammaproteobacteria bacterium]MBV9697227.1 S9 family peptidase [Gammaproteobacteria bacterium]
MAATLLAGTALAIAAARSTYPTAPRATAVDDYHGVRVADPYRPLEALDAPATRAWLHAEAQLTERYFATRPGRAAMRRRLTELYRYERTGVPFSESGRYFYTNNNGAQEQSVLLSAYPLGGEERVALDPNALTGAARGIVTGYVANRAGTLLAYGVAVGGSDWTDWHVRDLATGSDLPEVLRWSKYYKPVFTPDGRGIYYGAFPAPAAGTELSAADRGHALYYHALGTPTAADRRVFGDAAHRDWQYQPSLSEDGRWLVIASGEGEVGDKGVEDLYLIDLSDPAAAARPLAQGFRAAFEYVGADGGRLFFLTSLEAPNGRVVALDPARAGPPVWRSVVPPGTDAISLGSQSVTLVAHQLIVRTLHDAHSRLERYDLDGRPRGEVSLPGVGAVSGFAGHAADAESFYAFSNLVTPPTIYRYDFASGASQVWRAPHVAFAPEGFEQRQVFYSARDGTRIPLLLAYRRGLNLKARNPLILYGYGGFGISLVPQFDPARIAWLERGGVFAIANIRGGGEYGEAWHRQATLTHKQVVFDDFIAAAEWLIANDYTSRAHLGIYGGSNGGLLVGACLTQRPELYGAAVAQVGVLDMLRFNLFGQGAGWEGDYGSPQDPEQFAALYAYSPVHNVHPGVHYPPTLIITGDHDTRVMPMHSFKFTAALQAAQAGPAPILLAVDIASGHSGGETVSQAILQKSDTYTFFLRNLGAAVPAGDAP